MNRWTRTVWSGTREETAGLSLACRCGWMRGKIASRKEFCASGLRLFDSRRLHPMFLQSEKCSQWIAERGTSIAASDFRASFIMGGGPHR
jgi:hypothetical protein